MHRLRIFATLALALALAVTLGAGRASADFIFELTTGNSAISGFTGPYATVDVHLTDSTHATITFASLAAAGNIYLMGTAGAAAVNVNASSFSVGSFSASNAGTGFSPGPRGWAWLLGYLSVSCDDRKERESSLSVLLAESAGQVLRHIKRIMLSGIVPVAKRQGQAAFWNLCQRG
jgi:hypothetical protein